MQPPQCQSLLEVYSERFVTLDASGEAENQVRSEITAELCPSHLEAVVHSPTERVPDKLHPVGNVRPHSGIDQRATTERRARCRQN